MSINDLFTKEVQVINTGLESFKNDLESVGVKVIQLDWKPPITVSLEATKIIEKNSELIEKANQEVMSRILSAKPYLVGLSTAGEVIPGMKKNLILHAGPPVKWENMSGPTKGAVIGALIYEGLATNENEAKELAASGKIEFAPCHEHDTVGPMAGIVSYSMPVSIIENKSLGNKAFCTLNEGLGKALRFGAFSTEVITKLKWMEEVLYPSLKKAVASVDGGIDLKNIIAQALHMGDEVHNRNRAATSLFYRTIVPYLVNVIDDKETLVSVLNFINGNDHFFLNLVMPAGKATLDAARGVKGSSILVCMARNGTEFGIQLAGTNRQWFTGEAPVPDALFFPGFTKEDAGRDIGDSTITESFGLGGFSIAASPAIVQFVGGSASDAVNYTKQMYDITDAENNVFQIPALNFRGVPTGINVVKVIENGVTPFINTGVAHKNPGVGQVGAGILSAPTDPFKKAYEGLANSLK